MVTYIQEIPGTGSFAVTFNLGLFEGRDSNLVVAGTFNEWSTCYEPTSTGVVYTPRHHKEMTVELPPGYHEYKYYDATHGQWVEYEAHPELYYGRHHLFIYNPFGTRNCVLDLRTGE